jgi:hypothetical protein
MQFISNIFVDVVLIIIIIFNIKLFVVIIYYNVVDEINIIGLFVRIFLGIFTCRFWRFSFRLFLIASSITDCCIDSIPICCGL